MKRQLRRICFQCENPRKNPKLEAMTNMQGLVRLKKKNQSTNQTKNPNLTLKQKENLLKMPLGWFCVSHGY